MKRSSSILEGIASPYQDVVECHLKVYMLFTFNPLIILMQFRKKPTSPCIIFIENPIACTKKVTGYNVNEKHISSSFYTNSPYRLTNI